MTFEEGLLVYILTNIQDESIKATILQSHVQEHGPLSEEAGDKVKEILGR